MQHGQRIHRRGENTNLDVTLVSYAGHSTTDKHARIISSSITQSSKLKSLRRCQLSIVKISSVTCTNQSL